METFFFFDANFFPAFFFSTRFATFRLSEIGKKRVNVEIERVFRFKINILQNSTSNISELSHPKDFKAPKNWTNAPDTHQKHMGYLPFPEANIHH